MTDTTDVVARLRAMHKPRTQRHGSGCVQCGIVWPCPTSRVLDEAAPVGRIADAVLSDTERQFLTFALDQAADEMSFGDGFTDEDHAALEKLRRMADEAQQPETQAADEPPCTCAAAGDCFAPAGHYADCPAAVAQPVEARQADTAGEQQ